MRVGLAFVVFLLTGLSGANLARAEAQSGSIDVPYRSETCAEPGPETEERPADDCDLPLAGTFRERWFQSQSLGRAMPYLVYQPAGYDASTQRYPTLYLLHGGSAHRSEWVGVGLIVAVDRLIQTGQIEPLLVVLPQGDYSYWANHPGGGPRWGDYVAFDLVQQVDASFRTRPTPNGRAIGGLSMGGHGALTLAFDHPDVFGVVGAHSPSLRLDDGSMPLLGSGPEFVRHDPIQLASSAPGLELLVIWIDLGEVDPWLWRGEQLHQALLARQVPHEWRVLQGGHDTAYWQRHVETYLRFYDRALRGSQSAREPGLGSERTEAGRRPA